MGSTFVTAASDWIDESLQDVASMFPDDGDMFRTAAPKFLETDWIDESLRDVASMFSDDGDENESIIAHKAPMTGLHVCYNPAQPDDMFMGSTFVTTLLRRVAGALVFFIAAGISRRFLDAA